MKLFLYLCVYFMMLLIGSISIMQLAVIINHAWIIILALPLGIALRACCDIVVGYTLWEALRDLDK